MWALHENDDDDEQKQGGAVFLRGAEGVPEPIWSRATLVDTQLVNNRALEGSTGIDGRGGGVFVSYRGNLTTFRTLFYKNDAVRSFPSPTRRLHSPVSPQTSRLLRSVPP